MSLRFWALASVYHAALLLLVQQRAGAWLRRELTTQPGFHFLGALLADALVVGGAGIVLALVVGTAMPDPAFAVIRLWSQTLFGEAWLYLVFVTALHLRRDLRGRSVFVAISALLLTAVYVDAYHVEPHLLRVERQELDLGDSPSAGPSVRSVRLVHVSDIQTDQVGGYEHRVLRELTQLEPDLVVMTGDYVQERLTPTGKTAAHELCELYRRHGPRPPLGTYAVGGDTDDFDLERRFSQIGIRWLQDEALTLQLPGGQPLTILGLGPAASRDLRGRTLRRLLAQAPRQSARIAIGHAPDYFLALGPELSVDLALAGHTHGGQVVLPWLGPPLTLSGVPRHIAAGGLHRYHGTPVRVSRGVGLERGAAPQIRFLCPPEVCVLTLRYEALGAVGSASARPSRTHTRDQR